MGDQALQKLGSGVIDAARVLEQGVTGFLNFAPVWRMSPSAQITLFYKCTESTSSSFPSSSQHF